MYALKESFAPRSGSAARPTRASLKTRPRNQRALIRSWEYIQPVRVSVFIVRLLTVLWLVVLSALLMLNGFTWGWTLLPADVAIATLSVWVFSTAGKGWPAVEA